MSYRGILSPFMRLIAADYLKGRSAMDTAKKIHAKVQAGMTVTRWHDNWALEHVRQLDLTGIARNVSYVRRSWFDVYVRRIVSRRTVRRQAHLSR